jgi:hypothetical protein
MKITPETGKGGLAERQKKALCDAFLTAVRPWSTGP